MFRWLVTGVTALALAACTAPAPGLPAPAPAGTQGSGGVNRPAHEQAPYVVLISFDGFRPDYLGRFDLPHLRRAMARGAHARAMTPVFPTLTFPNHYSLVTGLHPGRHGIVANSFYDPRLDRSYSLSDRDAVGDGVWYRGEPIWVTAERQGMVAACFFWPGSEAPIRGVRPTFWNAYDASIPNEDRVRQVLDWLRMPADRRPHLITLYFSDVDTASHRGPLDSPAVAEAARGLDRQLGLLLDGIETLPIRDRVYVIVTSDHGMIETSATHVVRLDTLVDLTQVRIGFAGPVTALHVGGDAARARALRDRLNAALRHGRAWLREEVPERLHFRDSPRAGDVVVLMEPPWRLSPGPDRRGSDTPFGMHGWDPAIPELQALFLAVGPDIAPGLAVDRVHNVDVYPFLTEILGLTPAAEIDGRPGAIRAALGGERAEVERARIRRERRFNTEERSYGAQRRATGPLGTTGPPRARRPAVGGARGARLGALQATRFSPFVSVPPFLRVCISPLPPAPRTSASSDLAFSISAPSALSRYDFAPPPPDLSSPPRATERNLGTSPG